MKHNNTSLLLDFHHFQCESDNSGVTGNKPTKPVTIVRACVSTFVSMELLDFCKETLLMSDKTSCFQRNHMTSPAVFVMFL